jgi:hypothetical protein
LLDGWGIYNNSFNIVNITLAVCFIPNLIKPKFIHVTVHCRSASSFPDFATQNEEIKEIAKHYTAEASGYSMNVF